MMVPGPLTETSLDHTQFRQYTSQLARWLSPDPAGIAAVDPSNPQSWNRYSYVLNNPIDLVDPLGLDPDPCDKSTAPGGCVSVSADLRSRGTGLGGGGDVAPPSLIFKGDGNSSGQTIGPTPPSPPSTQPVTVGCMTTALLQNFVGDKAHTVATVGVHVVAYAAVKYGTKRLAAMALPGPGWVYVGLAATWDVIMITKSYADCKKTGGLNPQ